MKKNIPRLGIEPQNCKMSWFETWCLSPLDHEISIGNWMIYQYINRGKTSKKPPKCPNLLPYSLGLNFLQLFLCCIPCSKFTDNLHEIGHHFYTYKYLLS